MAEKGKTEKHAEEVQFAAYKQFCDDTSAYKRKAISEAEEAIEMLTADIAKYTADIAQLEKDIGGLETDIATWASEKEEATKVRKNESATYMVTHKDYSESVDACQRAITVLKNQAHDRVQAASLAQVRALKNFNLIPPKARRAIDAFLSTEENGVEAAPEANAYEFQSGGIVDMLEKLEDKFLDERTTLEKEELNARGAYNLLMQDLKAQTDAATQSKTEKAQALAKAKQAKALAEGDHQETTAVLNDDKTYLADLVSGYNQKASDFESRQTLRAQEIVAIEKAIEIIGGDTVAGAGAKYLPSLVQKSTQAFAQLRADGGRKHLDPVRQRLALYLDSQARLINSRVLSTLAAHVEDDPFGKVKKMIKDLINRLLEQANEEADHKGWCDTELSTNEQTRNEKTTKVERLNAEIDETKAAISQLTDEIADLTAGIAELAGAMAAATKQRDAEKATNEATIQDAQEAQTALAQALAVLKEFYGKAKDATALIQHKKVKQMPDIFDSAYKGMQSESGGVIGMLEVIESDFSRLEADTQSSEATSQSAYDKFMEDSRVDKAAKEASSTHKTAQKADKEGVLTTALQDLDGTQKELDAALGYYEKLKPSCVNSGVSYEDRVARRKEEINSLQEALRILAGEDIAF